MKSFIDARELACPKPVILVKNSMKDADEIEVHVDNETAVENIKRLSESSGYGFTFEKVEDFFRIILVKGSGSQPLPGNESFAPSCSCSGTVVAVTSDVMGSGDDELGRLLMKAFIHTLTTLEDKPAKIIFYNSGVKLAAEGSGVNDDLELLVNTGCDLLICGTCVNFYNLKENIKTGTISNMFDIVNNLNSAARIIRP